VTTVYWVLIANCEIKQTSYSDTFQSFSFSQYILCIEHQQLTASWVPGCNSRPIQLTATYNSSVIRELQNDAQIKFDNENMVVAMESIKGGANKQQNLLGPWLE